VASDYCAAPGLAFTRGVPGQGDSQFVAPHPEK
jgi:hypothetical protein